MAAALQNLFVFDTELACEDEGAGLTELTEQILFFSPRSTPLVEQMRTVNLVRGLLAFSSGFENATERKARPTIPGAKLAPPAKSGSMELDDSLYVFHECEPGIWIVMIMSHPRQAEEKRRFKLPGSSSSSSSSSSSDSGSSKSKRDDGDRRGRGRGDANAKRLDDGRKPVRGAIDPAVARTVLESVHVAYALFFGTLRQGIFPPVPAAERGDEDEEEEEPAVRVIQRLRRSLRKALRTQKMVASGDIAETERLTERIASIPELQAMLGVAEAASPLIRVRAQLGSVLADQLPVVDFGRLSLFHALSIGFHFFPADRVTYLSIHFFLNNLHLRNPRSILASAFLFDAHLVSYHNMHQEDIRHIATALRGRSLARALADAQRMSLPFVLEPKDGSVFCRPIYLHAPRGHTRSRWGRLVVFQEGRVRLLLVLAEPLEFAEPTGGAGAGAGTGAGAGAGEGGRQPPPQRRGDPAMCAHLVSEIRSEARQLGQVIATQYARLLERQAAHGLGHDRGKQPQYIYFNRINVALKTSGIVPPRGRSRAGGGGAIAQRLASRRSYSSSRAGGGLPPGVGGSGNSPPSVKQLSAALPVGVLRALDELHVRLHGVGEAADAAATADDLAVALARADGLEGRTVAGAICSPIETFVKTRHHGWIVARRSGTRQFYFLLSAELPTPVEAEQAVLDLCDSFFFNILME